MFSYVCDDSNNSSARNKKQKAKTKNSNNKTYIFNLPAKEKSAKSSAVPELLTAKAASSFPLQIFLHSEVIMASSSSSSLVAFILSRIAFPTARTFSKGGGAEAEEEDEGSAKREICFWIKGSSSLSDLRND